MVGSTLNICPQATAKTQHTLERLCFKLLYSTICSVMASLNKALIHVIQESVERQSQRKT